MTSSHQNQKKFLPGIFIQSYWISETFNKNNNQVPSKIWDWKKKTTAIKPVVATAGNLTKKWTSFYSSGSLGKAPRNSKNSLQVELHVLPLSFHSLVNILRYTQERNTTPRAPLTTEGYLSSWKTLYRNNLSKQDMLSTGFYFNTVGN